MLVYSLLCAAAGTKNISHKAAAPPPPVNVSSSSDVHQQRTELSVITTDSSSVTAATESLSSPAGGRLEMANVTSRVPLSDVQPSLGLGAVMVEHVRRKTGFSHDKSQLAVATVMNVLAERVPVTENLVSAVLEDIQHQHVCILFSCYYTPPLLARTVFCFVFAEPILSCLS